MAVYAPTIKSQQCDTCTSDRLVARQRPGKMS